MPTAQGIDRRRADTATEPSALARQIGDVLFEHVRRELNKDADQLANEAMDEAAAAQT